MKLVITKAEAGRYIVSAITLRRDIRFWEFCREYNEDTMAFDGKRWSLYETNLTTGEMREWVNCWNSKAEAIGFIKLAVRLENLVAQG